MRRKGANYGKNIKLSYWIKNKTKTNKSSWFDDVGLFIVLYFYMRRNVTYTHTINKERPSSSSDQSYLNAGQLRHTHQPDRRISAGVLL